MNLIHSIFYTSAHPEIANNTFGTRIKEGGEGDMTYMSYMTMQGHDKILKGEKGNIYDLNILLIHFTVLCMIALSTTYFMLHNKLHI